METFSAGVLAIIITIIALWVTISRGADSKSCLL